MVVRKIEFRYALPIIASSLLPITSPSQGSTGQAIRQESHVGSEGTATTSQRVPAASGSPWLLCGISESNG